MTASEDERDSVTGADREASTWPREFDAEGSGTAHRNGDRADIAAEPDTEAPRDERTGRPGGEPAKPVRKGSFWKELPILIVIALVLTFLIQTFIARVYVIPSGSMELTLNGCTGCTGDRILVDKLTFDFTDPRPGDVIVFKGPPGWDQSEYNVDETNNVVVKWLRQFGSSIGIGTPPEYDLVKRIIAVGGQTIQCCNAQHQVLVNGKPLNEPYIYILPGTESAAYKAFGPITIPKGDLWVEGDSRGNSDDSRLQDGGGIRGVVPVSDVIGVARTIIWPPSRWRGIGETNPQTIALASAPAWQEGVPLGTGLAAAFPALWLGKRTRRGLRTTYALARNRIRR